MPSFAEGYGLPVAEALAVGTPVLASDIPVFRAIAGDRITRLSTIDGEGWLKAIVSIADNGSGEAARRQPDTDAAPTLASYFEDVDAFLRTL
jgi:glycosyltransferase involved in cell wall biosynthesis